MLYVARVDRLEEDAKACRSARLEGLRGIPETLAGESVSILPEQSQPQNDRTKN